MLFLTIVKGDISLISFASYLSSVCRRATGFFELILYADKLLKVFISCRSSLVEFLGSLMYTIISLANRKSLISSIPICIPLISFCCLIALARILSTILHRYGESGQPCLIPDFSGITLSFSPFSLMLAVGLLYIAFIMLGNVPCIPALSETLIIKGYWISLKAFSVSDVMIMWFFSFTLFIWGLY